MFNAHIFINNFLMTTMPYSIAYGCVNDTHDVPLVPTLLQ